MNVGADMQSSPEGMGICASTLHYFRTYTSTHA